MSIRFSCPYCHERLQTPYRAAGHAVNCSRCKNILTVPRLPVLSFQTLTLSRVLTLGSLTWLVSLQVWQHLIETSNAVWATCVLIAFNFLISIRELVVYKRLAVALTLTQFALFTVVQYQIYCAWGPHHFRVDQAPVLLDWVVLIGAHILRALGVLAFLDRYGIHIQNIRPNSIVFC